MINVKLHIKFNTSVASIDWGVDHLRKILSLGSSQEICIPYKLKSKLCQSHTELDVTILEKHENDHAVDLSIEYPICMCGSGSGISTFLGSLLYYTVFSFVDEYHIRDFDLMDEDEAFALFSGPKHGIIGIRELCGEPVHPLMGLILKPRTKIDLISQSQVVEELVSSKSINYIIDDELVVSPRCCQYEDKIDCYSAMVNKIRNLYSHTILYWINASCDIPIAEKIIEYGLSKGISTFSLNAVTMGFTSVKYIIDKFSKDALFLVNNIGRGIFTRQSGFFISERVLSKISRLIGADAVYTGPLTQDFAYNVEILNEERAALQDNWRSYKKSFCVSSGNIDGTKNTKENIQALGKDTMIQMGAGLLKKDNNDVINKLSVLRFMVSNALDQEIMKYLGDAFATPFSTNGKTTMIAKSTERRDFFISYNNADEDWAKWIAETLEVNGYKTYIQAWDINPGDDFIVKMQDFLTNSERFIPVLSSTYMNAPYCKAEWASALAIAIKDNPAFLVPVRIVNFFPEGLLKTRVYIDLFDTQEDEATRRLLQCIKHDDRRQSNGFPEKDSAIRSKVTSSKPFPLSAKSLGINETVIPEDLGKVSMTKINQQDKKRINLLEKKLSDQVNTRIRLIDALSKTRDPLEEGRFENDLEKCEATIIEFALHITEMSIQYSDIDIGQVLTSNLLDVCKRNAWKVEDSDCQEIKNELVAISQGIISDTISSGKPLEEAEIFASKISTKETLELIIPIFPLLLDFKTVLSFETNLNFKKLVLLLFCKIKGVLS